MTVDSEAWRSARGAPVWPGCLFLAGLSLLMTSCMQYSKPQEAMPVLPESFASVSQGLSKTSSPDRWWTVFGDEQLDALVAEALDNNQSLQAVEARLRAAQARTRAATASLIPEISFTATHRAGSDEFARSSDNRGSLGAAYEIDLWGRIRANRTAALKEAEASQQDLFAAQITLSANIATTWYQLGASAQQLDLIRQEREAYERILGLVEIRHRHGLSPVSDVLRQRQLIESTRSLQAAAEAELGSQRISMETLLGKIAGSGEYLGAAPPELSEARVSGVPTEVVQRRPDVHQTWLRVLSADAAVATSIANRFPRLSLSYTYASPTPSVTGFFSSWVDNLVASAALPLIDGGARRSEVDRSRAVLDQRVAEYKDSVINAFAEISEALLRDHKSAEQLASIEEQLRLSDAVIEQLEREHRNGTTDFLNLLNAQVTNSNLRRDVISARLRQTSQRITLLRAVAGPLPADPSALLNLNKEAM